MIVRTPAVPGIPLFREYLRARRVPTMCQLLRKHSSQNPRVLRFLIVRSEQTRQHRHGMNTHGQSLHRPVPGAERARGPAWGKESLCAGGAVSPVPGGSPGRESAEHLRRVESFEGGATSALESEKQRE